MTRFEQKKQNNSWKYVLVICIFIAVIALFYCGVDAFSRSTTERQKEALENAVQSGITFCYATEGKYPDSAEYLEEHYGLTYDKEKFYVGYQPRGANILPDVTIVELED